MFLSGDPIRITAVVKPVEPPLEAWEYSLSLRIILDDESWERRARVEAADESRGPRQHQLLYVGVHAGNQVDNFHSRMLSAKLLSACDEATRILLAREINLNPECSRAT